MSAGIACGPNGDDRYCPRFWELSAEAGRLREERDALRAELDDIGTACVNAPEDGDSFGLLEELAMRIAACGVPLEGSPDPGPFPCCQHCTDGDGMLPCGDFHDEPCGTGDCGLVTDAELAEWRKGIQL